MNVFAPVKVWFPFSSATFVDSRPSATVPVVNCDAFRLLKLEPVPLNVPMKVFALLLKITGPDRCR